jgi:hypothetical protein
VGIEVGPKMFATLSTGQEVANPPLLPPRGTRAGQGATGAPQAHQGHPQRATQRQVVARVHARTRWRRSDFTHQQSRRIDNACDLLAVEDLSVNRMAHHQRVPDFPDLPGTDGKRYSLASFADRLELVLAFLSVGCPTVKLGEARLIAMQEAYRLHGVQFVAINSNNAYLSPSDTLDEMTKRAAETGYSFPYLKDADGSVASACGAISTPHVFLFDQARRLPYRGRIDNARDPAQATASDLEQALADMLAGMAIQVPETPPFWCAIVQ